MQAMVFLEDSGNVTAFNTHLGFQPPLKRGIFSPFVYNEPNHSPLEGLGVDIKTYAATTTDYSKRFPKTDGDTLGILLSTATGTLNQPVQESGTGVDIINATGSYTMSLVTG